MKTVITILFLICTLFNEAQTKKDTTLTLEGIYSNKNLIVKNSYGPGGVGFCVTEVKVNGKITRDEINGNFFQIHFDSLKLKTGDKLKIEIKHFKGCAPLSGPMILNPSDIYDPNSEIFIMEGNYMWQNLFVFNPRISAQEFSIKEIKVNGKNIPVNINTGLCEINLNKLNLESDQKIKIEFMHAKKNGPVILNPEAIR